MIENEYQIVDELNCEELYFLKKKDRFQNKGLLNKIDNKCNFNMDKLL
ncbi:hypothetical protein HN385_02140 [archaeon]|jgi:hypothetical protein|nr:hypothetical protein [archaeon]MBT3450354.1 hypothetical protein [archaeon]MBT6868871.1 hypothetical protein [archaeon]MBT7192908.1 hypothetical protein [archaeon]MBT7380874.1 hypothetical protein [archaeon]